VTRVTIFFVVVGFDSAYYWLKHRTPTEAKLLANILPTGSVVLQFDIMWCKRNAVWCDSPKIPYCNTRQYYQTL